MRRPHRLVVRALAVLTVLTGVTYIAWRWTASVNWPAWWIAVPLVVAETYSLIDTLMLVLTLWRPAVHTSPPAPMPEASVDVFVATYDEPLELVMATAVAARDIRGRHRTWILDDGDRDDLRAAAEHAGIGYLTRTEDWDGLPRHAKAGNLNNALFLTTGEFILVLDADQVPRSNILERTLGYFADDDVALVQTPQYFANVRRPDVLGNDAPFFYGPIQQGKDGWNAAYFCGTNAVLRREALMQAGIADFVDQAHASGDGPADEALPISPIRTLSVTEDMATSMQLHARGWRSVFHDELLAVGLAPETFADMVRQRLRWAQGAVQILLRDFPFVKRGLSVMQRIMYFGSTWGYLGGFATLAYLLVPLVYLFTGVLPVRAFDQQFFLFFVPYFVIGQVFVRVAASGQPLWRGQQYSFALFPVWIRACVTGAANVWFARPLAFTVTPKGGARSSRTEGLRLAWPQLAAIVALVGAFIVGCTRLAGGTTDPVGVTITLGWITLDLLLLSAVPRALLRGARLRGTGEAVR